MKNNNRKPFLHLIALAALTAACLACNTNTYSSELQAEKDLIADYINRQGIQVIEQDSMPTEWTEKLYWKVPYYDNLYFHLVERGDTTKAGIETNDYVNIRYREYTLTEYPDTISMWNTNDISYPTQLQYGVSSSSSCVAWQVAIGYMEYSGAQCKIICPSKLGFNSSQVTPYGYDMKLQIKRY